MKLVRADGKALEHRVQPIHPLHTSMIDDPARTLDETIRIHQSRPTECEVNTQHAYTATKEKTMSRVPLVEPTDSDARVRSQLTKIGAAFGTVPNMFRAVANSPAALQSMWGAFGAFSTGSLGPALTEQIAVAVADRNSCAYCLAAHTALGKGAGLDERTLAESQHARDTDPRTQALLEFAVSIVEQRGQIDAQAIQTLREHGWTDEQIVETIAQVALNLFTNYINIALDVPVDFPHVPFHT